MQWFYESGGQRQGPVEAAEFERLISTGTIKPETLVWREGMADWAPLSVAQDSATASLGERQRCDSCGNSFPPSDLIQIGDRRICATCKPGVLEQVQGGASLSSIGQQARTGPPWEQRAQLGFAKAMWETFRGVLLNPAQTFSTMKREGGFGAPLLYNVILGSVGGIAGLAFQFALGFGMGNVTGDGPGAEAPALPALFSQGMLVIGAVLMPAFVILGAFVYGGVLHLSLMVCQGAKQPFETTFRVYNYAAGSTAALQLVPFCGAYVGGIWFLVSTCIGIARSHEINGGRAVLAVLLPSVVCCVAVFAIIGAVVGAAAAAAGAAGSP